MNKDLTYRLGLAAGRIVTIFSDGTVLPYIRGGDGDTPDLAGLLAQAADVTALDDDELVTLDADVTAAAEVLGASGVDDDTLQLLVQAGEVVQAIRAEQENRSAAAEQREADAQAALALIRGESDPGDGDDGEADDGDDTGDDGDDTGDAGASDEPEPEAEPQPSDAPAGDDGDDTEATAEDTREPVAASRRAPLTRTRVRRPASSRPRPQSGQRSATSPFAGLSLTAAANAPGLTAGAPIVNHDQLAAGIVEAVEATRGYRHGPPVKVPVFRIGLGERQYPDEFHLSGDLASNMERIEQAQRNVQARGGVQAAQQQGMTAAAGQPILGAGGICAPQQVNYDLPTLGAIDRPMRDGFMVRFGADRGGVRTLPMPLLGDLTGAIDVWTEADDIAAASNDGGQDDVTKPCLTITCPDEDETIVEAITRCIQYGNFRARFFPEQIEAWMRLLAVEASRYAEQRLLAAVSTGSTAVTTGQLLGTTRTVLAALDRAIAVWRYRHRLPDTYRLAWAAPRWLREQVRADIARQLPTGTVNDTLAVTDAQIDAWFAARAVDPTWLLDGESGQRFTSQPVGTLQAWPNTVKTYMAPAGSWLFLDGGELVVGVWRDTALVETNDVKFFAETFEGAHFHGPESWTVTFDTCPDGSVSAAIDIDPCTTGS